jgi:glycerophosphoryl diester phosphodiesterase
MVPQVIAHRGAWNRYPENTIEAFVEAAVLGADGVEFDVHATADGAVVVHHDDILGRVFPGSGRIVEHTLAELRQCKAGAALCGIPTLAETLEALSSFATLSLNIELKTDTTDYPGIEGKVVAAVRDAGLRDRCIVSSFNHESLRRVAALDRSLALALLYMEPLFNVGAYAQTVGASAVHPYLATLRPAHVRACRERGIAVRPFTIATREQAQRALELEVDALITDDVPMCRRLINGAFASHSEIT